MARPKADWEKIYNEYRTGQYSNRVLGTRNNISEAAIRKKAKAEGWKKDLIDAYQSEVQNLLIESEPEEEQDSAKCEPEESTQKEDKKPKTDGERKEDRDTVRDAARVAVEVVRDHRKDITKLKGLARTLSTMLDNALNNKDDDKKKKAREDLKEVSSHTESATDMTLKLSRIHSECIKLERTSFNLDKKDRDPTADTDVTIDERIKKRMEKLKNARK